MWEWRAKPFRLTVTRSLEKELALSEVLSVDKSGAGQSCRIHQREKRLQPSITQWKGKTRRAEAVRLKKRNQNLTIGNQLLQSCLIRKDKVECSKMTYPFNGKKTRQYLASGTGSGSKGHRCWLSYKPRKHPDFFHCSLGQCLTPSYSLQSHKCSGLCQPH